MTSVYREPIFDVAQLGHTELLTPKLEESAIFFTEVYELHPVAETADSIYLRAWNDDVLTSLRLTASAHAGLGHVARRASSPQGLVRRVVALEGRGIEGRWIDGDVGHGPAYAFTAPGGHAMEVYFETEKCRPEPEQRSYLPNQPQKYAPHGVVAAHIDHFNLLVPDVRASRSFQEEVLDFKLRERLVPAGDAEVGAWLSLTTKAHDLALTREPADTDGRLHHLAYAVETREDVRRAAGLFMENGVPGVRARQASTHPGVLPVRVRTRRQPHRSARRRHTHLLALLRAGHLDHRSRGRGTAWGLLVPASFHTHATPVLVD